MAERAVSADVLALLDRAIADLAGLRSTAATTTRLLSSLDSRCTTRNTRPELYPDLLRDDPTELQAFLELLTVQETSFFRDGAHFTALAEKLLPAMPPGPVTIWSAGCSTGQEAYSLAMLLEERAIRDWRIVASDIATVALERTAAGWYRDRELRGLSTARRNRWFRKVDGGWQVRDELRDRVRVVRHNLATETPPIGGSDCRLVFCRNVLIYVRRDRISAFVSRMAGWLPVGGHLFLGASEVLWDVDPRFDLVRLGEGAFAYRRAEVAAARPEVPPPTPAPPPRRTRPTIVAPDATEREYARRSARRETDRKRAAASGRVVDSGNAGGVAELRRQGEAAAAGGDHIAAVAAFRKAIYLDADDPVTHLHLGLALEAAGDPIAARRAFRAAQTAVARSDDAVLERRLEGFGVAAVRELLQAKLGPVT